MADREIDIEHLPQTNLFNQVVKKAAYGWQVREVARTGCVEELHHQIKDQVTYQDGLTVAGATQRGLARRVCVERVTDIVMQSCRAMTQWRLIHDVIMDEAKDVKKLDREEYLTNIVKRGVGVGSGIEGKRDKWSQTFAARTDGVKVRKNLVKVWVGEARVVAVGAVFKKGTK
jgi:hypothetical protein